MQIIGITGLPSSGKGTFCGVAHDFNFHEIIMGDVIRNELKRRGLAVDRENSNRIMVQLRQERGENVVAEITAEWINDAIGEGEKRILIDGIRSMSEVNYFKDRFPDLRIIAIHADPETRYLRSKSRNRQDDAYSKETFEERDRVELSVGIGDVIALSDIMIPSPETLDEAEVLFAEVLQEITSPNPHIGVLHG